MEIKSEGGLEGRGYSEERRRRDGGRGRETGREREGGQREGKIGRERGRETEREGGRRVLEFVSLQCG